VKVIGSCDIYNRCAHPFGCFLYAQTLRRQLDRPPLTGFDLYVRWYRKYAPGDAVLEGLEKEAREAKKGLWADPQPVPPWEWRKRKERA